MSKVVDFPIKKTRQPTDAEIEAAISVLKQTNVSLLPPNAQAALQQMALTILQDTI